MKRNEGLAYYGFRCIVNWFGRCAGHCANAPIKPLGSVENLVNGAIARTGEDHKKNSGQTAENHRFEAALHGLSIHKPVNFAKL
jgi:hypothetical protein